MKFRKSMNSPVAVAVGHFGDGFTRSDIEGSEEVFSGCDGCRSWVRR